MFSLDSLDREFNKTKTPSNADSVLFYFLEHGVSLKEFIELPMPYIMSMVEVLAWHNKEKEKAMKRKK